MEEIKKALKNWCNNESDFDPKLVAREETGCCDACSSMVGAKPTQDTETPCNE